MGLKIMYISYWRMRRTYRQKWDTTMPKEGKDLKLIIISKQKQLNTYESLQLMNGLEAKDSQIPIQSHLELENPR